MGSLLLTNHRCAGIPYFRPNSLLPRHVWTSDATSGGAWITISLNLMVADRALTSAGIWSTERRQCPVVLSEPRSLSTDILPAQFIINLTTAACAFHAITQMSSRCFLPLQSCDCVLPNKPKYSAVLNGPDW